MPDPFKAKLTARNPLPEARVDHAPALDRSGYQMAQDGYSVLERADRKDPYNMNLRGSAPPVDNDTPNVAWDEEK